MNSIANTEREVPALSFHRREASIMSGIVLQIQEEKSLYRTGATLAGWVKLGHKKGTIKGIYTKHQHLRKKKNIKKYKIYYIPQLVIAREIKQFFLFFTFLELTQVFASV